MKSMQKESLMNGNECRLSECERVKKDAAGLVAVVVSNELVEW
jgi:hypothetical protein